MSGCGGAVLAPTCLCPFNKDYAGHFHLTSNCTLHMPRFSCIVLVTQNSHITDPDSVSGCSIYCGTVFMVFSPLAFSSPPPLLLLRRVFQICTCLHLYRWRNKLVVSPLCVVRIDKLLLVTDVSALGDNNICFGSQWRLSAPVAITNYKLFFFSAHAYSRALFWRMYLRSGLHDLLVLLVFWSFFLLYLSPYLNWTLSAIKKSERRNV